MKRTYFGFCAIVALAAMLTSCIKEQIVDSPALRVPSKTICFGMPSDWGDMEDVTRAGATPNRVCKHDLTSEDGELSLPVGVYVEERFAPSAPAETRGTVITSADGITSFNVWAEFTNTSDETIEYFSDVTYKNTSGVFYPENEVDEYYWPGSGTLNFTAVANASDTFAPVTADGAWTGYFQYTTPADATQQNDIMLAYAPDVAGDTNGSVPLTFRHIMAAVNIKIGSVVAGEIRSIKLTNVYNQGVFDPSANRWIVDETSTADFAVKMDGDKFAVDANTTSGTLVNATNATFLFIPQEPMTGAEMIVEFYDEETGYLYADGDSDTEHNALRGKIEGDIWDMAKTVNYNLSIDESFTLTIEPVGKKLDAHYIISEVNVTVDGISAWQITATASDGANVTILPHDEANPLAQQGFWTDKQVDASGNILKDGDKEISARGESSYPGSGTITQEKFLLFIPENISNADRKIELLLSSTVTGSTAKSTKILYQKSPNWTGTIGWEVVDDDEEGKYGFKWNRKVVYEHKYGWTRLSILDNDGSGSWYTRSTAKGYATSLISQYGASSYAHTGYFATSDEFLGVYSERMYIYIDYTKLNNLSGASSTSDGHSNTTALFNVGGSAASMAFETAISTALKSPDDKNGQDDPLAFRVLESVEDYDSSTTYATNDVAMNDLSGILTYILKKNRYYLYYAYDGNTQTYHAHFDINDLVWYLPASGQFSEFVANPELENDIPANYWSSTAADGSEYAFRGSGAQEDRSTELRVIAVRKDVNGYGTTTATVTVDNTSMAGGENGESTVWVSE